MRKLLVASQKGGVGKTTTSINLAAATAMAGARVLLLDADPLSSISASLNLTQHAQRQSLRQGGVDLPGVLVSNVIPGLDVLSPYDDGGCSDEDLDGLLALLATPAFQECYGCMVIDTPPFLGANPGQLLATCDEFILVMRAEPMAYRTLPAFLELVQRSRTPSKGVNLRGILLTLPDGEQAGGRWERELRGRFGSRILPHVIPFDQSVGEALLFGQIVSHAHKDSSLGQAYHGLVGHLEMATDARETIERTSAASALLLASASLKDRAVARKPVERPAPAAARPTSPAAALSRPERVAPPPVPPEPRHTIPSTAPNLDELPTPVRRRVTPVRPIPAVSPSARAAEAAAARATPPALASTAPAPAQPAPTAPVSTPEGFPMAQGVLWVGLAIVVGVGLRFMKLPDFIVPVIVGVAVASVVILVMRNLLPQNEDPTPISVVDKERTARTSVEGRTTAERRLHKAKRRVTVGPSEVSEN